MGLLDNMSAFGSNLLKSVTGALASNTQSQTEPEVTETKTTTYPDGEQQTTEVTEPTTQPVPQAVPDTNVNMSQYFDLMGFNPETEQKINQLQLESIARQPKLDLSDYFPSAGTPILQGQVQGEGISAPIYASGGERVPMAMYEAKERRDKTQEAIDKMREQATWNPIKTFGIEVPQAVLNQTYNNAIIEQTPKIMKEMVDKYGVDVVRKQGSSLPEWRKFVNEYKSIETALKSANKDATEYMKTVLADKDNHFYKSAEALKAAQAMVDGFNLIADGDSNAENLKKIAENHKKLVIWDNFDTAVDEKLKVVKGSDQIIGLSQEIPLMVQENKDGATDQNYQAVKKDYPGGYMQYLIAIKSKQLAKEQATAIFDSWVTSNPGAVQQLYTQEGDDYAKVRTRTVQQLQDRFGREIETAVKEYMPKANTYINVGTGSTQTGSIGLYGTTAEKMPEVTATIQTNLSKGGYDTPEKVKGLAKQVFGNISKSWTPSSKYFGVEVPNHFGNTEYESNALPFSDYYTTDASGKMIKGGVSKTLRGDMADNPQATPTLSKIESVTVTYGKQNADGSWDILTPEQVAKSKQIDFVNYKPIVVQKERLNYEVKIPIGLGGLQFKTEKNSLDGYKVYDYTPDAVNALDRKTNPAGKEEFSTGGKKTETDLG